MKALVTGASGFIGSPLTEHLIHSGWQVRCLLRRTSSLRWLDGLPIDLVTDDLIHPRNLSRALIDVDVVFHAAGVTKAANRHAFFEGNLLTTRHLVDACARSGNADLRFIYISSLSAAGPSLNGRPLEEDDPPAPVSWYGRSKLLAEDTVLRGFPPELLRIIRPPIVYGPRDRDFLQVFECVSLGFHFVARPGCQRVNFIHVDDLVRGILLAARWKGNNQPTFFMTGEGDHDWPSIGKSVGRALGRKPLMLPIPVPVLQGIGGVGSFLSKAMGKALVLNVDKIREATQPHWLCSNAKATEQLGFYPSITLDEGLASTADWYRKAGWLRHSPSQPFMRT